MTSRSIARAAAGVAALALAAATSTAAHADSFRHRDATGDVLVTAVGSSGTRTYVDPTQRRPDLQQLTVLHSRWTVEVASSFRGLESIDNDWGATIVTSKGDRFLVRHVVSTGANVPGAFITVSRNGYRFKCDGITVSRTSSGIISKVPTRCLGNPWKVRVGVQATSYYNEGGDPEVSGHDDALRTGAYTDRRPALSSWIAR